MRATADSDENKTRITEAGKELFEHFITDELVLFRLASQTNLIQKCVEVILKLKTPVFNKEKLINDIVTAMGKLFDKTFTLDAKWHNLFNNSNNLQLIDDFVAPYRKVGSVDPWRLWFDTSLVR